MVGLLLLGTLLLYTAPITKGCEFNWRTELKLHGRMHPWLGPFFSKLDYERTKLLLECIYNSSVTLVRSSNFYQPETVLEQVKNSAEQWHGYMTRALELQSQGRAHSEEMMNLIYKIRKQSDQFQQRGTPVHEDYTEILNLLPNNMRAIVFGKGTFIKTQAFSYFVSATAISWGKGFMVQTCKARTCRTQTSEWYFEPHEKNGRLYFYIRNNYTDGGSVLALGNIKADFYSRFLEVQEKNVHDNNQKWFVKPVEDGRFVIRNWNGPYINAHKGRCWASTSECLWSNYRPGRKQNILTDGLFMQNLRMKYPKGCENDNFRQLIIETESF